MPRMLTMAAALALAAALLPGGLAGDGAAQAQTDDESVVISEPTVTFEAGEPTEEIAERDARGALFVSTPDGGDKAQVLVTAPEDMTVGDLDSLSYEALREAGATGEQIASINIITDPFTTLVYEPAYDFGITVADEEWQRFDAFSDDANWWTSRALDDGQSFRPDDAPADPAVCAGAKAACWTPYENIVDAFGDADIAAIVVNQGSGNAGLESYVDFVEVNGVTYDFAPVTNETQGTGHGTIQEAVDEAEVGDVLRASPGVYEESVTINGVEGLTLIGEDGAVIEGRLRIGNPSSPDSASGTTVEGFTVSSGEDMPTGRGIGVTESDDVVFRDLTVEGFATGVSLDFAGATPSDVTIEGSEFASNGTAIGSTEDVETLTVTDNTFTGNNNGVGLGAGAEGVTVSGNTFDPDNNAYLTDYRDTGAEPSLADILGDNDFERAALVDDVGRVRPDMSSALGSSIGLASALAAEGATIEVIAGTYEEEVTIDAAGVELRGPNAGIPGASGERVDEAVIDGKVVIDDVDGVTVDGFTIEDGGDRLVQPQGSDGTEVRNNVLRDSLRAVQGDVLGRPDNLTVDGNLFETDFGIAGTEGVDGLTVEGNVFATTEEAIGLGGGAGDVTVEGNRFEGEGEHIRIYDGPLVPGFLGLYLADNDFATAATVWQGSVLIGPAIHASIQGAVDEATPGQTVRVEAGTYEEQVRVDVDALTLTGADAGDRPVIQPASLGGGQVLEVAADDVSVEDLAIATGDQPGSGRGIVARNQRDVTLDNVEVTGLATGVRLQSTQGVATLTNSTLTGHISGLAVSGGVDELVVTDNDFQDNGNGIGVDADLNRVDIAENTFAAATLLGDLPPGAETSDVFFIRVRDRDDEDADEIVSISGFLGDNTFPDGAAGTADSTVVDGGGNAVAGIAQPLASDVVDHAQNDATVLVAPGTYEEQITVTVDGLTLKAADPDDRPVIRGSTAGVVRIDADGVAVERVDVESTDAEADDRGFALVSGDGTTLDGVSAEGFKTGVSLQFAGGPPSDVTITDSTFNENASAIGGTEDVDGLTLSDNTFSDNGEGVGLGEGLRQLVIDDNTFAITDIDGAEGLDPEGQGTYVRDYAGVLDADDEAPFEGIVEANAFDPPAAVDDSETGVALIADPAPAPAPGPAPDPGDPDDDEDEAPDEDEGVLGDDVARLAGETRVETAVRISEEQFEEGSVDTVILARDDDYADALAAGPLAYAVDAPILLTPTGDLDDATAAEVDRLGAERAYVLGLEAAISTSAEDELVAETGVSETTRLAGTDRFETAVEIADELAEVTGVEGFGEVYLTEGTNADPLRGWPDAVAVSGLASAQQRPILLATADDLPEATSAALGDLAVDEVTIVGGQAAVSAEVEASVEGLGADVERLAGPNRYATSVAVAEASVEAGFGPEQVWLATGRDFPDAVAGGPAVARDEGVLVLVDGDDPDGSADSIDWLDDNAEQREQLRLLGGEEAIAQSVLDALGE